VRQGQTVALRERSKQLACVAACLSTPLPFPTEWLSVEAEARRATVTALPDASAIPFPARLQLVIEFYSQRT
jgi:ribosomal protein S4